MVTITDLQDLQDRLPKSPQLLPNPLSREENRSSTQTYLMLQVNYQVKRLLRKDQA